MLTAHANRSRCPDTMTKWPLPSFFRSNPASQIQPDRTTSPSFQILSDLHLEATKSYRTFTVPPRSTNLILAGDIGRLVDYADYLHFLRQQTAQFARVFLVLGNHEFYGLSHHEGIQKARELAQEPSLEDRVILLDRGRYDILDTKVTVLGCSLWTFVPDKNKEDVRSKIQDYRMIDGWSIDAHNRAHREDLAWLQEQIRLIKEKESGRQIVVVTHHAPMSKGTSEPQHAGSAVSSAFATDLLVNRTLRKGEWDGVKMWVFGHTHFSTEFEKGGIRVVSNQRGYAMPWMEKKDFDTGKVVHL
ncbi:calcineurin-like phosphoesterase [Aspergillus recurvatus]